MTHVLTRGQRLLVAVELRVHIELCLELLRRQIRHGVTEVEIVGEMRTLAAQVFILRRRLKVCGKCPLRIRKRTAARAHHLGEPPLLIRRNLLVCTQIEDRLDCLVDIALMNVLAEGGVVVHPTHCTVLSNLKYAISGGQPIRIGNQLPLPVCT